jgi:hypothetical protein
LKKEKKNPSFVFIPVLWRKKEMDQKKHFIRSENLNFLPPFFQDESSGIDRGFFGLRLKFDI